jgi:hypothetical protein
MMTTAADYSRNSNSNSNSINSNLKKINNDVLLTSDAVVAGGSTTMTTTKSNNNSNKQTTKQAKNNNNNNNNNNTVVFENPAKQKRINMINKEIDDIIDKLKEYFGYHMMDELFVTDDIKDALTKGALNIAYRKIYYDVIQDQIIYFPSCKELILSYTLMEEAEKYYYDTEDEFPVEYSKGLRTVVSSSSAAAASTTTTITGGGGGGGSGSGGFKKVKEKNKNKGNDDDDDDDGSIGCNDNDDNDDNKLGSDIIERLAMSWREAIYDDEE